MGANSLAMIAQWSVWTFDELLRATRELCWALATMMLWLSKEEELCELEWGGAGAGAAPVAGLLRLWLL